MIRRAAASIVTFRCLLTAVVAVVLVVGAPGLDRHAAARAAERAEVVPAAMSPEEYKSLGERYAREAKRREVERQSPEAKERRKERKRAFRDLDRGRALALAKAEFGNLLLGAPGLGLKAGETATFLEGTALP